MPPQKTLPKTNKNIAKELSSSRCWRPPATPWVPNAQPADAGAPHRQNRSKENPWRPVMASEVYWVVQKCRLIRVGDRCLMCLCLLMSTFWVMRHRCTMLHILTLVRTKHSEMRRSQWAKTSAAHISKKVREWNNLFFSIFIYFHQCTSSRFTKNAWWHGTNPNINKNNSQHKHLPAQKNPSIRQNHDPLCPVTDIFFSPWCRCSSSTVTPHVSSPAQALVTTTKVAFPFEHFLLIGLECKAHLIDNFNLDHLPFACFLKKTYDSKYDIDSIQALGDKTKGIPLRCTRRRANGIMIFFQSGRRRGCHSCEKARDRNGLERRTGMMNFLRKKWPYILLQSINLPPNVRLGTDRAIRWWKLRYLTFCSASTRKHPS